MSNRNVLHKNKLEDFKVWCDKNDIVYEETGYDYEVLRLVGVGEKPLIFYARSSPTDHITVPAEAMKFVNRFLNDRKSSTPNEIVICSAVKTTDGQIVRGHRHGDCIHTIYRMNLVPDTAIEAQGFVTSSNRYVTRDEGRRLQDAAGIPSIAPEGYRGSTLFSEDLY